MKKTPGVGGWFVQRCARASRQFGVVGAVLAAAIGAYAQTLAVGTVAGTVGTSSPFSNTSPVTFNNPYGVAVDGSGNAYIADTSNHVIRKISAAGVVSTLVGSPGNFALVNDATAGAPAARFNAPRGIAINSAGTTLYVADTTNNAIRVISLSGVGGTVTGVSTLAGTGSPGSLDSGAASTFNGPRGIVVNNAGDTLYIADTFNHTIRSIVIAGPTVSTVAGLAGTPGTANGDNTTARFDAPWGIAVNNAGTTLFVADFNNHAIRKIVLTPAVAVTTYAGTIGTAGFTNNASGTSALFRNPAGLANDGSDNLYVGEFGNNAVRLIAAATGNAVTTVAGGTTGSADGSGSNAQFNGPTGVAARTVSSTLFVFVVDTVNQLIRKAAPPSAASVGSPSNQGVLVGGTATFTATVTGGWPTPTLQWWRQAGGTGNFAAITASATYVGVNTQTLTVNNVTAAMNNDKFKLIATNASGAPESSVATLTVNQPPTYNPATATITATVGQPLNFSAAATTGTAPITYGPSNIGSFSVHPTSGAITGTPSSTADSTSGTITATNTFGSATLNVTINVVVASAPSISAQPQPFTVAAGQTTASFSVTATGAPAITGYVWQRQAGGAGSFADVASGTPSGATYTTTSGGATLNISGVGPAMNNDVFRVLVTNSVGTTTSNTALLAVAGTLPTVSTSPQNATKFIGENATFDGSFSGGAPAPTLKWQRQPAGTTGFSDITEGAPYTGTTGTTLTVTSVTAAMSGDQFRLKASNVYGDVFTSAATLTTNAAAPAISQSPVSISRDLGQSASFTAAATGNPSPTLRWFRFRVSTGWQELAEASPYSGTQTGTLTISSVTADMNGDQFRLRATNDSGQAESSAATLTINNAQPAFTTAPQSVSVNVGTTNVTFSATATGNPSYRWKRQQNGASGFLDLTDDGTFSGTTSTTLTIGTVTAAMNGDKFLLVASNTFGSTTSPEATLAVISAAPSFTTQPVNQTVNAGQNASFSVVVTGSPTPTLRWQRQQSGTTGFVDLTDNGIYSGTTSSTLTITGVTLIMSGDQFRASATNDTNASTASNPATLIVNLGTTFTTFAGQVGVAGSLDGTGIAAQFNAPTGIAVGIDGTIYIADTANHVIRKVTANGVVTTLAGRAGITGSVDGAASDARFNSPQGVAVDNVGNVYVSDTFNHTIRVIGTSGVVSTLAGSANSSGSLDGQGNAARFFLPAGLAVDGSGTIYVADSSNHLIRRVSSGGFVSTYAGTAGVSGFVNNSGTAARFSFPTGVAIDSGGNVYVADSLNNAIRKIAPGGSVSTLAGSGTVGTADANGTAAQFSRPNGVAVDSSGNVYVADTLASTLRKITSTGDVTTIAGLPGVPGSADGAGQSARFNQPYGVALDISGNIYVLDTRNHTIRRSGSAFAPTISAQPVSKLAAAGETVLFTVTATGTPTPTYQWQRATADSPDLFFNLSNDGTFIGVNTNQLAISSVNSTMNGSRFRVIVTNGVLPAATSEIATLTIGAPPVFTSASSASFRAGEQGSFTVSVTNPTSNAATFSLSGNPSWLTINPSSGVLSGTPPDTSGSPLTFTVTANNGVSASQTFTLTLLPAQVGPSFTNQPVSATVNQGDSVTFSVSVAGTEPFTYQWRRNGVAIPGATAASLTLVNVQPSSAAGYSVAVTNVVRTEVSSTATLSVNTAPVFSLQPHAQVAVAGSSVTFTAPATGGNLSYQWRKNGVAIPGANSSTYTLPSVSAVDAGNYDVLVSNPLGTVGSSLAQLTIVSAPTAPVITAQPAARTALVGSSVTIAAAASGAPAPTYQWRKDGSNLLGQTNATLTLSPVQASDAANYDVVISNSVSTVTSNPAGLRVITRSYAGVYFGSLAGVGEFALYIREDNTGVFLGYLPGSSAPIVALNFIVGDNGLFSFAQNAIASVSTTADEPARAAALAAVTVVGAITSDGSVTGTMTGGANASISGSRAPDGGATQAYSGYYQAGATANAATVYTIASADNRAFVVAQTASSSDGGRGTITSSGAISVSTSRSIITENISPNGTLTGTSSGGVLANFSGGSDAALARQRLLNISSRARVASADSVAIAGFVISGEESKPVLIRAVGPTLSQFGVAGALAAPRLELFRGSTSLGVNTGVGTNRAAIDAAGTQAGAFALGTAGTDAAILTTLAPGNYTAVVSSTTTAAGVALVEVYDLSAATPGQKLLNISTRASAGTAENTLTAGFVVPPGAAKRVLVRAIGPGLTPFGVTGVLAQPILTLLNGSTTVATNTNWRTSADQADITQVSAQVGGFGLATNDSAVLVTLPPGNYTAQVVGSGGATGVALIEVYEVP